MAEITFPMDHPLYGPTGGIHGTPAQALGNLPLQVVLPDGNVAHIRDPQVQQMYAGPQGRRQGGDHVTLRADTGDPQYDADALFIGKRSIQHDGVLRGLPMKLALAGIPANPQVVNKLAEAYRQALRGGDGMVQLPLPGLPPQQAFDPSDQLEEGEEYAAQPQMQQPMMPQEQMPQEQISPRANIAVSGWYEESAWVEANDVEAQKPEANIEYNENPTVHDWYEDDPEMDMAEHHASWQVEALGETQLDGGVGGSPTSEWNPQVDGPNADLAPSPDNAQNSPEQEVALETWVTFAATELQNGTPPEVIEGKMLKAGAPPELIQKAIEIAQQQAQDMRPDNAGQDAFAGQPTVPAQTQPGEQGGVSMPQQTMSSVHESEYHYVKKHGDKWVITQKGTGKVLSEHDSEEQAKSAFRAMEMHMHGAMDVEHRRIVEATEAREQERANRKIADTGLWGEQLAVPQELPSSELSPAEELQSFIDSFEPVDETRQASVMARIANLKLLRQSIRQVPMSKLTHAEQVLIDNMDVDAQLGILNLTSKLDDFIASPLAELPTYKVDGLGLENVPPPPMDESPEAAEILVSELPAEMLADETALTYAAFNANVLPANVIEAARRVATDEPVAVMEDEVDDGPAEELFY